MSAPTRTLITAAAGFEAARRLEALPPGHRSRRLHGHSFVARVRCALPPGWATFPGGETDELRSALDVAVAALDYRLLDEQLAHPTDANLARWLRGRIAAPGIEQVGIRSSPNAGVDLDAAGHAQLWRRYRFESAHQLPNVPPGHKCGRMHGHGFEVVVHADQDASAPGSALDHDQLDTIWAPLQAQLHHDCLNDLPGLENPTSETLSSWLWQRLGPVLPGLSGVTVYETGSCGAHYDGAHYRIWKELTLDSALQLRRAPDASPLRRVHGHTYTLRLHLCAPLDQIKGWTLDFGDVKQLFAPVFDALDHRPLFEVEGLADCDTASVAQWILKQAQRQLPQLDRVDLFETPGCGAIVLGRGEAPALPM